MADKDKKAAQVSEACAFYEGTQTVKYANDKDTPTIAFNFIVKRQKSARTNKERLVITATEADDTLMGEITTTIPSLQEGLLGLREYGVVVPRAVYGKVAKQIEQNYLKLSVEMIEFEQVLTNEILIDILGMVIDYILENTSEVKLYESIVNDKECYNIPAVEFADIFKDSEYSAFELSEIKKALKAKGYSICSTGRYDRTIYNTGSKKSDKVISLDKELIITALPKFPEDKKSEENTDSSTTLPSLPDAEP